MLTIDFLKRLLRKQASQADFLPKISQHVTPNIVHFNDGYMLFCLKLQGIPFESVNDSYLNNQFKALALVYAGAGKNLSDRLAIWTTLKRRHKTFNRDYAAENLFCQSFTEKYMKRFNGAEFFDNHFYLSVLLKYEDFEDGIKEVEELIGFFMSNLQSYEPTLLTVYQNQEGIQFSEVYSFLGALINYDEKHIPLTPTPAQYILGEAELHFGSDVLEIRSAETTKYATCWDLKDFGISQVQVLTGILDLPVEFTLTQSFIYIENAKIQRDIDMQLNNLQSAGDQAILQQEELIEGKGAVTSGEVMFGSYHASLIVYSDTPKDLLRKSSLVTSRFLSSGGFLFKKASYSAPLTYFSQVVGVKKRPRASPKTTVNLATTFGMHNYSCGKAYGNPLGDGSSIMPLLTRAGTIFDFNFHFTNPNQDSVGDAIAGHTLILGATGTGKTTLETALLTFTNRFNPALFALDLDAGLQIFIQALGGSYFKLNGGEPSGLNPFQLPDTQETREFLNQLVAVCGQDSHGKVTAEEEKQIKTAIDALFNMDSELRNFSTLLQSIPYSTQGDSLRARLSRWCRSEGGRFAWCLDNPKNLFNPEDFDKIGFDLTDILKDNYPPTEPVMMYLFYLRDLMLERIHEQGGILCTVVEECWYPLRYKATQEQILKILKTDRKRGGWAILATQSPEDVIKSEIFPALVQQTPTKIYLPNPDAKYEGSYEQTGLTQKEYDELVKLSLDSRTFLVKQSKQSAFAKMDLYGFDDEMAVLSGNASNLEILNNLLKEQDFKTANEWYPIFINLVRESRNARRLKVY